MKMFGPDFVWILTPDAGGVDEWVEMVEKEKLRANTRNQTDRTCTREQYEVVVNRTFILVESDLREDVNTSTASNLVRKFSEDAHPPPPLPTPSGSREVISWTPPKLTVLQKWSVLNLC